MPAPADPHRHRPLGLQTPRGRFARRNDRCHPCFVALRLLLMSAPITRDTIAVCAIMAGWVGVHYLVEWLATRPVLAAVFCAACFAFAARQLREVARW